MPKISLDCDFFDHPKVRRLIGLLGRGAEVLPIRLWCYCGKYLAESGKLASHGPQEIESICAWWGAEGKMIEAMLHVGLLYKDENGFYIHDWLAHQGHLTLNKERASRAARSRWLTEQCSGNSPSNATAMLKHPGSIVFDSSSSSFVFLDSNKKQREDLFKEKLVVFKDKFPAVDVEAEIKKMEAWAVANPKNRKSNWARFMVNWLIKAQDRAKTEGKRYL